MARTMKTAPRYPASKRSAAGDDPPLQDSSVKKAKTSKTEEAIRRVCMLASATYNLPSQRPSEATDKLDSVEDALESIHLTRDANREDDTKPAVNYTYKGKAYRRFEVNRSYRYIGPADAVRDVPSAFWHQVYSRAFNEKYNRVSMAVRDGNIIRLYTWHCLRIVNGGLFSYDDPNRSGYEDEATEYDNGGDFEDDRAEGVVELVTMGRTPNGRDTSETARRWVKRTVTRFDVSTPEGISKLRAAGVYRWCPAGFIPDVYTAPCHTSCARLAGCQVSAAERCMHGHPAHPLLLLRCCSLMTWPECMRACRVA